MSPILISSCGAAAQEEYTPVLALSIGFMGISMSRFKHPSPGLSWLTIVGTSFVFLGIDAVVSNERVVHGLGWCGIATIPRL